MVVARTCRQDGSAAAPGDLAGTGPARSACSGAAAPGLPGSAGSAGPAGLTYACLVADGNRVTVFERETTAGGALRHAGKAPLFQDVPTKQAAFDRYIESMVAACMHRGVIVLFGVDVIREPEPLAHYDRIVIATGARYPFGLTPLVNLLLHHGIARWPA